MVLGKNDEPTPGKTRLRKKSKHQSNLLCMRLPFFYFYFDNTKDISIGRQKSTSGAGAYINNQKFSALSVHRATLRYSTIASTKSPHKIFYIFVLRFVMEKICLLLCLFTFTKCRAQEDSLQSALNAINRRQRDLSDYSRYDYAYEDLYPGSLPRYNLPEGKDELAFLGQDYNANDEPHREKKKRISSPFRERLEEERERKKEKLAELLINKLEEERDGDDNEEYEELIQELWQKYNLYDYPKVYTNENKKRTYYPNFGYDSIGMRKRNRYVETDSPSESLYLLNYNPREEMFNRMQQDDDDDEFSNYRNMRERKFVPHQQVFSYSLRKRFPVTKRSSNYQNEHKHPAKKQIGKTDPKVEKELSNIFGTPKTKTDETTKKPEKTILKPRQTEHAAENLNKTTKPAVANKIAQTPKEKPLQIKKKSIDWSKYFGLDRRKKFDEDDIDDEWLMDRYHKAVAMATKRSAEYPLQNFRDHDGKDTNDKKDTTINDAKIHEMDTKLKSLEDSIVDEALKFTGAHDGATDPKEVQQVKDLVISRLAAAYSLEKMRRALGEYKESIAKERDRLKEVGKSDEFLMEEKRVSVPRKQAVDDEVVAESDNNIKCTQDDEDCEEQNYRVPSNILEEVEWQKDDCPKIGKICKDTGVILGNYGELFESACRLHQRCLLCGENAWFAPTRQCNVLFLAKAYESCGGNIECQKEAQRSVRYFLDVNRSLRAEPLENCDIVCPDNRRR